MSTLSRPQRKTTYVVSKEESNWLLNEQRKLYARAFENTDHVFRKLWGLCTDLRNLRAALSQVSRNKGARTAGIDGITVRMILESGVEKFLQELRAELRSKAFRPSPVRRIMIPKPGKPGKFRPLGIPTVKDRVVQSALRNIMEPIFEADFYPTSYGFRPGRSVHGAMEHLRKCLNSKEIKKATTKEIPRLTYQVAIEGDIKGCFDNISHHGLMNRIRRRIDDNKINRLILSFLKAGIVSEAQFMRTETGTPQGGILSPLLANIALSIIEERYTRYVWPRQNRDGSILTDSKSIKKRAIKARTYDKSVGKPIFFPVRYADDFIILVYAPSGPKQSERAVELARQEKTELAKMLTEEMGLELSASKTKVTPVTTPLRFLGFTLRVQYNPKSRWISKIVIPKSKSNKVRQAIKDVFSSNTLNKSLRNRLTKLNLILRGWGYSYRHAWKAKSVFKSIDNYVWHTILGWLKKKHSGKGVKYLHALYKKYIPGSRGTLWSDRGVTPFRLASIPVYRFRLGWTKPPKYVSTFAESPVHNERCTPGLEEGASETAR